MLDLSVFIILIITCKKMFNISSLKYKNWINRKIALISIIIAFIISALVNCHFLISFSIVEAKVLTGHKQVNLNITNQSKYNNTIIVNKCVPVKFFKFYEHYWPFMDATIYSFLPFALLTTFNIMTFIFFKKTKIKRLKYDMRYKPGILRFGQAIKACQDNSIKILPNISTSFSHDISNRSNTTFEYGKFSNKKIGASSPDTQIQNSSGLKKVRQVNEKTKLNSCEDFSSRKLNIRFDEVKNIISIERLDKMVEEYAKTEKKSEKSIAIKVKYENEEQNFKGIGKRLIIIIFLINFLFFILSMPIATLELISTFPHVQIDSSLKAVAEILQYLNHCSNFFCYCISGDKFRKEAKLFIIYFLNLIICLCIDVKNSLREIFYLFFF
jgi:hypothetical protein